MGQQTVGNGAQKGQEIDWSKKWPDCLSDEEFAEQTTELNEEAVADILSCLVSQQDTLGLSA
jgi:hypothetical protein